MKGPMKNSRGRAKLFKFAVVPYVLVSSLVFSQSALGATTPKKAAVTNTVLKKAGRVTDITNTIMSGKGAPSASLGLAGDFYIDTVSMNFYGPKTSSKWPTPLSLKGPAGPTGPSGLDGKIGSTQSGLRGETGATGATGAKGLTGETGAVGAAGPAGPGGSGSAGATGPAGAVGLTGAAGSAGATGATGSSGSTGARGDTGLTGSTGNNGSTGSVGNTGAKGDTGLTGSTGSDGATGARGPVGPSEIQYLTFPNSKMKGTGVSTVSFGTLVAGLSYVFNIQLYGEFATNTTLDPGVGAEIICTAATSVFTSSVTGSMGDFSTASAYKTRTSFVINGVVVASGVGAMLKINIFDLLGNSSGNEMTFTGTALIQHVETLTPAVTM